MKIVVLHLSDIHLREGWSNPILSRSNLVAAAVSSIALDAHACFTVITGDVAFSGKNEEFALANGFLAELRESLRSRLIQCECRFVLIPGNHDCDFSESGKVREVLLHNMTAERFDEEIFAKATEVQARYRDFAAGWRSAEAQSDEISKLYWREVHIVSGERIEFRLINSAWMSTLSEHQGGLLFPIALLQTNITDPTASLVVTALHHPYNWFEATNGRALRNQAESMSDVVLTGHEHEGDQYRKESSRGDQTEYLEGGLLQDTNPNVSHFNVLIIDLERKEQEVLLFHWDGNAYVADVTSPVPFVRNRYRLRNEFTLQQSFERFLRDPGTSFAHPGKEEVFLDDIFVYPDLRRVRLPGEKEPSVLIPADQAAHSILSQRRTLLLGGDKCGRTALCKVLFQFLRGSGYVPLYVMGPHFKGCQRNAVLATIKHALSEEYATPSSVDRFFQLEHSRRAIVVDDFHKATLNLHGREQVIKLLESMFDIIILVGDEQLRFDYVIDGDQKGPVLWQFAPCEILPFGYLRRSVLIEKWYSLGRQFTHSESDISRLTTHAEQTVSLLIGRNFLPAYPIFILIILQQMEAGIPLNTSSTSRSSYGFLYESLLTTALARSSKEDKDLDTKYSYLSELAYSMFSMRVQSIGIDEALQWHHQYCDEYSLYLNFETMLSELCEAFVLRNEDNVIAFRYTYIYYYFVARYLRDHIGEQPIRDHICRMSQRLHLTESANILLFLTYLSKDPFILSSILNASHSLFSSYDECDLAHDTGFLSEQMMTVPQLVLDASNPSSNRRRLLAQRDEIEAAEPDHDGLAAVDEDRGKLDADLHEALQVNVAFKTIQILGQILRNFPGSLKGSQKLELAKETYSLGLRALNSVFKSLEANMEGVVYLIVDFIRSQRTELPDDQVVREVKAFLCNLAEGFSFVVLKHIADSIGLETLSPTFAQLLNQTVNISYRFIDLAIRLDYFRGFPERGIFQLYKDVQKSQFAMELVRRLVWYHFYICPAKYDLRQRICAKLNIKLLPADAHDQRVKRLTA